MDFEKEVNKLQNLLLDEQEQEHVVVVVLIFPNGKVYFIEDDDELIQEIKTEWQSALTEEEKQKYNGTRVHGGAVKIVMLKEDFDTLNVNPEGRWAWADLYEIEGQEHNPNKNPNLMVFTRVWVPAGED